MAGGAQKCTGGVCWFKWFEGDDAGVAPRWRRSHARRVPPRPSRPSRDAAVRRRGRRSPESSARPIPAPRAPPDAHAYANYREEKIHNAITAHLSPDAAEDTQQNAPEPLVCAQWCGDKHDAAKLDDNHLHNKPKTTITKVMTN